MIQPSSLAGWWQLNTSNGLSCEDRSTNGLSLIFSAPDEAVVPSSASAEGGTVWRPGLFDNGAQLDGAYYFSAQVVGAQGQAAYSLGGPGGDITFSAWVKTAAAADNQVIARWLDASGNGWSLDTASNGQLRARFSTASDGNQVVQDVGVQRVVKDRVWHQAALSYSAASGEVRVYLDGRLEAMRVITGTFGSGAGWAAAEFRIGDKGWGSPWLGAVDEIRYYKKALSEAEVASLPATYADMDGNGLNTLQEMVLGTHPGVRDTDEDGIPDGAEAVLGLNATNGADGSAIAASGLSRLAEYRAGLDAANAMAGSSIEPAHVAGYWPFGLNSTNVAPQLANAFYVLDHSASAWPGELRGVAAVDRAQAFGAGKVHNGLVLNENGGYLEVKPSASSSSSSQVMLLANYSVSAWVKTSDTSSSNVIFQFLDAQGLGWELGAVNTGAVRALIDTSAATGGQVDQVVRNWSGNAKLINNGQWHQVTLTFVGSSRTAFLYVDGTLEATRQIAGTHGLTPVTLKIGSGWGASWKGSLDEVWLWDVTLLSAEVASLYQTAIAAFGSGNSTAGGSGSGNGTGTGGTGTSGGTQGSGGASSSGGTAYVPGEPTIGENLVAVVKHRPYINGTLNGSLQQLLPEDVSLNNGSSITGDLLVPGVPQVTLNGQANQLSFGGIKTGTGAATPTNFRLTLNGGSTLRNLVTRIDPITLPAAEVPANPTGNRYVSLNNANDVPGDGATLRDLSLNANTGTVSVPPGAYGSFNINGQRVVKLGVAVTEPAASSAFVARVQQELQSHPEIKRLLIADDGADIKSPGSGPDRLEAALRPLGFPIYYMEGGAAAFTAFSQQQTRLLQTRQVTLGNQASTHTSEQTRGPVVRGAGCGTCGK